MRQQQEQLVLLEELEEKRRKLEWHLKEAQQERQMLEDAAQVHSGIEEVKPLRDPAPEVCIIAKTVSYECDISVLSSELAFLCCLLKITAGDTHTLRLHQYQQRLLEQNRSVWDIFVVCNQYK